MLMRVYTIAVTDSTRATSHVCDKSLLTAGDCMVMEAVGNCAWTVKESVGYWTVKEAVGD